MLCIRGAFAFFFVRHKPYTLHIACSLLAITIQYVQVASLPSWWDYNTQRNNIYFVSSAHTLKTIFNTIAVPPPYIMSEEGKYYTRSPAMSCESSKSSMFSSSRGSSASDITTTSSRGLRSRLRSSVKMSRIKLFGLVEKQRWSKIRKHLSKMKWTEICKETDDTGLTLLGISIVFAAPLDIIELILSIDPNQFYTTDMYGATPLHMACLNGASPKAVQQLMQFGCDVTIRDVDRRVPLHHTVECICLDGIDFDEGLQVIKLLCDADPTMVFARDKLSDTPIDIVQIARITATGAENVEKIRRFETLYIILRDVNINLYKQRKARWELMGPDYSNSLSRRIDDSGENSKDSQSTAQSTSGSTNPTSLIVHHSSLSEPADA